MRKPQLEIPARSSPSCCVAEGAPQLGTSLSEHSLCAKAYRTRRETIRHREEACQSDLSLSVHAFQKQLLYSVSQICAASYFGDSLRGRFDSPALDGSGASWLDPKQELPRNAAQSDPMRRTGSHPSLRRKKLDASYGRPNGNAGSVTCCHSCRSLTFAARHKTRKRRASPHAVSLNSI